MNPRFVYPALSALILLCVLSPFTIAGGRKTTTVDKVMTIQSYRAFLANKVFSYYGNNGDGSFNLYRSDNEGLEFPAGSGKTLMFEEGIVWGGYSKGSLRPLVGGSTYTHAVQPGKILVPGTATSNPVPDDPSLARYRLYSVRRQITPSTPIDNATVQALLAADLALLSRYTYVTMQDLYDQYVADWTNWPAADGAPYQDVNGNGRYDPLTDIPGVQGADQTLWYVANDMNPSTTQALSGSLPIGIEMQRTIYGFNASGPLASCIICVTRLINRSGAKIDSMYIAQWGDPDVGSGLDDFVGCDTLQSLGFAYNGTPVDQVYGTAVPAVGQLLLQGPVVPGSPGDTARFGGGFRPGFKNLPMSAFVFFVNGDTTYADPRLGPTGDVMWYHLMKGTISKSGGPFIDPTTGNPTKFCFSGDPVAGTGWVDGGPFVPGDRRMALIEGPLTMATGDTQEIVVATFAAQGADRLSSVSLLKSYATQIKRLTRNAVIAGIAPVDTLYPTHGAITLEGSATTIGPSNASLLWFLAGRPPTSKAGLVVTDSRHATITPDTPGVYRVGLVATIASADPDTALVDLHVTSVQRPVAAFSVNAIVTLGDTVMLDGSASHDPNGFPITLTWQVTGSRGFDLMTPRDTSSGFISSQTGVKVSFVPLRTALHSVSVDVGNGYFTSTSTKTFQVKPLASSNITLKGQLTSTTWQVNYLNAPGFGYTGYYYGWGGFKEFDGFIWADDGGLCGALNFRNYSLPYEIFSVEGFSFDGGGNYLVSTLGSVVYALQTNGFGGIRSSGLFLPFVQPTADSAVQSVMFKKPYVLLPCRKAGILVYDITNPASAVKVSQFANGEYWSSVVADGNLLFGVHATTKRVSIVDISNPAAIAPVALLQLDKAYGSITKVGRYFFLIKANTSTDYLTTNTDSIAIYDFSNLGAPLLKSYIGVPKTFNYNNRFNSVAGFDSLIITSTAEGVYLFDVKDPVVPVEVGHFLTGSYFSSVFMNASHMLAVNYNRVGSYFNDPYEYEGLLELQSPFTGVSNEHASGIPTSPHLYQNYPNPFNPSTTIKFELARASHVSLIVYDILGREVCVLVNDRRDAGVYEMKFDGSNLASGVYFYRIQAGSFVQTKKFLILR